MQSVLEDNANFIFEKHIYSAEFFKFVDSIFAETCAMRTQFKPIEQQNAIEKSLTQIGIKMIFSILAKAHNNNTIKTMTSEFIKLIQESIVSMSDFVNYLIDKFQSEIMTIYTKCPDKDVRIAIRDIISQAIITIYKYENIDELKTKLSIYANNILDGMLKSINNDLATNWSKFSNFFETLLIIAKENNVKLLKYLNANNLIRILVDFYLEKDSPFYEKGEKRVNMGGRFTNPNFESLIDLICILAENGDLTFAQPNDKNIRKIFGFPEILYEHNGDSKLAINSSRFIYKTITERHLTINFAKLIAFMSYNQRIYSKLISKFILRGIFNDLSQDLNSYFTLLYETLAINDELQNERIEWLLGIPHLSKGFAAFTVKDKPYEQIKIGLYLINTIKENVNEYPSPLAYKFSYDSILNLLWNHKRNFDINPILCLLNLLKIPAVFDYLVKLPPPTYQYAKYTDWIKPFIQTYKASGKGAGFISLLVSHLKDETNYIEAQKLITEFEQKWLKTTENLEKPLKPEILSSIYKPYIVGKPTGENLIKNETKEGVSLIITELITEIYESMPNGIENLSIPANYFEQNKQTEIEIGEKESKKTEKIELKPNSNEVSVLKFEARNCIFLIFLLI